MKIFFIESYRRKLENQLSKQSELVLWYTPDGSHGVCQRHEVGIIRLDDITDDEHDEIDDNESRERDLMSVLDKIAFRIANDSMKEVV